MNWWLKNVVRWSPKWVAKWVRASRPYYEALKEDDEIAWSVLPKRQALWIITDEGVLIQDTKWTAAAKVGAKKCLLSWVADVELNAGQIVWGDVSGVRKPYFGGGNVWHSITHLTADPEIAYKLKEWMDGGWLSHTQATWSGVAPIHVCAHFGFEPGIELILQKGEDVSRETIAGKVPLEYAVCSGRKENVMKLLYAGAWNIPQELKNRVIASIGESKNQQEMLQIFVENQLFDTTKSASE
jgi:hypothetical protein